MKMERSEIIERVTIIFREVFKDSSLVLHDDMTANDVENWDSLSHGMLITRIEEEFDIVFKMKDLLRLKRVGDLLNTVSSKLD